MKTYQQKRNAWELKKLAASAHNQNCEVMLNPKDYVHIAFLEKDVVKKWMECYDFYNDANKYQIN